MPEKINLFVNGQEVEVEKGKNLIDALMAVGIEIPHLCYHPALGADGNCRMCLVGIEDGRPPLVPACKTPAMEGMKVLLDAEHIKKIQRDVLEFELINHPTDCPVCDQAGECALQDYYMDYDGQKSRMTVPQVTKSKKMDFGAGVVHDQERCIICGRCVRFCRQITETGELGIVNRTDAARVTIFPGRPLNNKYALNVVDLCPVGAMTAKDFRFKQRVWFMKKERGVCHGCAKGCNITIDHHCEKDKDDMIYRFRPLLNEQVNGYFICDAGRLSYRNENENRLTEYRLSKTVKSQDDIIVASLRELERADKIAIIISPDSSLEQMISVQSLADKLGATLLGFSEGYIKKGDGDDYLIQEDKAANRAGLQLLGIDTSRKLFEATIKEADLIINFDNDLALSFDEPSLKKIMQGKQLISVASHDTVFTGMAHLTMPIASFSEYSGSVVNCDNILQTFKKAVTKNKQLLEMSEIVALLGGSLKDRKSRVDELKNAVTLLKDLDLDNVPAKGLKLTESEADNVPA